MNNKYDSFVYGKDQTERIVSIEVVKDKVILFIQKEDGSIVQEERSHKYWLMSNEKPGSKWIRMKGDLHYKWGYQTSDGDEARQLSYKLKNKYDIYNIYDPRESSMVNKGYTFFKGMKHNEPSVLSFDIETNGLHLTAFSKLYMITNTFKKNGIITRKLFSFDEYSSEGEMINAWCNWVLQIDPTVMCGHNIASYDLPYLEHIADMNKTSLKLGRDGSNIKFNRNESKFRKEASQYLYYNKSHIFGRQIIDTMFLAINYDRAERKYVSYGLKNIIAQEGLEQKNRQFYDASKIKDNINIPEELIKIKEYAKTDADDGLALYELMCPSLFYFANYIPKTYQSITESATGSQINAFLVRSYLQDAHSIPKASEVQKFQGAISFGVPGVYRNCFKIDVKSEYPSCILQYNIYDKDKDPNAYFYKMVEYFTLRRFEQKDMAKQTGDYYYTNLEQSSKILINSAYGLLGAKGLNFNSPHNAALVTAKGREIIETALMWASGQNAAYWIVKGDGEIETEGGYEESNNE